MAKDKDIYQAFDEAFERAVFPSTESLEATLNENQREFLLCCLNERLCQVLYWLEAQDPQPPIDEVRQRITSEVSEAIDNFKIAMESQLIPADICYPPVIGWKIL